ncbi:hypothetical protein HK097_000114 [Rhizophlyctis rosea]|uniref:UBX domain-containing protein 2 n=1 Tax=Rhizophlyctis rosea TaxID=64517 RepID=A0AAD5S7R8_9FUNG|nr:hypothetical protein HK097_000114 [Rhizophlyctis rosea]
MTDVCFWQGSVEEAVQAATLQKKLFVAFLTDNSPATSEFTRTLTTNAQLIDLLANQLVCIKLEKDSQPCQLFAQIYPIFATPALYIIKNGVCIEIILAVPTLPSSQEIHEKLSRHSGCLSHAGSSNEVDNVGVSSNAAGPSSANASGSDEIQTDFVVDESIQEFVGNSSDASKGADTVKDELRAEEDRSLKDDRESSSSATVEAVPVSVFISRAEEPHTLPINPVHASNTSVPAATTASPSTSSDITHAQTSSSPAAQPALAPIFSTQTTQSAQTPQRPIINIRKAPAELPPQEVADRPSLIPKIYDSSSLALRLPDGSVLRHKFDVGQKLRDVRSYVKENSQDIGGFEFVMNLPFKVYDDADESKTLKELDLVPSASLTLRPILKPSRTVPSIPGAPASAVSVGRSFVSGIGGIVLAIWALISGLVGGFFGAAGGRGAPATDEQRVGAGGEVIGTSGGGGRRSRDSGPRIRTLYDRDDSEDENRGTYNGNSTNQM